MMGYEYEFDPPLDKKFECSICLHCLKNPIQTKCGHRFCYECLTQWLRNSKCICPEDNAPINENEIFEDSFAKREILQLMVKCPYYSFGCKIFKLAVIEDHISVCRFKVEKRNICIGCQNIITSGSNVSAPALNVEETKKFNADNCFSKTDNQTDDKQTCLKFKFEEQQMNVYGTNPVCHSFCKHCYQCCNDYAELKATKLMRSQSECQSTRKSDTLSLYVNEYEKGLQDLSARVVYLEQKNRELEIEVKNLRSLFNSMQTSMELRLEGHLCSGLCFWKIPDVACLLQPNFGPKTFCSHSFYSSPQGYHMCLIATFCNGSISLFVHFVNGKFDSYLKWPFSGSLTLMILDQNEKVSLQEHLIEVAYAQQHLESFQRPLGSWNPKGFGYNDFATADFLMSNSYIKNNTLLIQAIIVENDLQSITEN